MFTLQNGFLFLSTLLCALITGLLYGYACSVNPGLSKLPDLPYLKAMQSINKEILNPLFFISFFGTLLVLPVTAWYCYQHAAPGAFYLIVTACLFYLIGVIGITIFGNVPLNDALALFEIDKATLAELSRQRNIFETNWNRYHNIRTVCSVFSLLFIIASIFKIYSK